MIEPKQLNLMEYRTSFLAVAVGLMVIALASLAFFGLNLGIDFTGGTLLERGFPRAVTAQEVRAVMDGPALADLELGGVVVQPLDNQQDVLIRMAPLTPDEIQRVDTALEETFGSAVNRRTEFVGPVIGAELVNRALWALGVAAVGVLIYVTFRFEYRFGLVALLAVLHDVLFTLGVMSLLGREISSPFIAAILTVVGYSLNDTIIVFDRVRENLRFRKRESITELVNKSIRQTLARSINTSFTTLLVIGALFLFGGPTIRDFTLALMVGVLAGTFSSIFVASPLWAAWKERDEQRARLARSTVS